jgi:hypothetical protein
VRPLCVEYGLNGKILVQRLSSNDLRTLSLEELLDELSISEALVCIENESAVLFPVRNTKAGPSAIDQKHNLEWKVVSYGGQTLVDILQAEIFSGRLVTFTAEDIHKISYPNVRFNRETHGSRVRVFIARLKKHFETNGLPLELNWENLKKCYEVKFGSEVIKLQGAGMNRNAV